MTPHRPSVRSLLLEGCPSAIARLIVSVVIRIAVDRVLRGGPRTDVLQKVFKAVKPAGADGDSTTAVVFEVCIAFIQATRPHRFPCCVNFRPGESVL